MPAAKGWFGWWPEWGRLRYRPGTRGHGRTGRGAESGVDCRSTFVLHRPDKSHPNPTGTYLAACVFYATLFDKSPVGLPAQIKSGGKLLVELSTDEAKRLQEIAWETVRGRSQKKADDGPPTRVSRTTGPVTPRRTNRSAPGRKLEENPIATTNLDIGVSGPGHQQFGWRHETSTRRQSIREVGVLAIDPLGQAALIPPYDRREEFALPVQEDDEPNLPLPY